MIELKHKLKCHGELKHKLKCHGSTTVGERGQVVLPTEARKLFGIEPGDKLIVLGADNKGCERIILMKSEAVTKMFEHVLQVERSLQEGKDFKAEAKQGIRKMKVALKKSGVKNVAKAGKR